MMHRILTNPNYHSGSLICKMSVNAATALWSLIVLSAPNAIARPSYAQVATYVKEDAIAAVLLFISISQTICLWAHWNPMRFGSLGYLAQLLWWTGVLTLVVIDWIRVGLVQPTATMGVALVSVLAAYAFISGPKRGTNGIGA